MNLSASKIHQIEHDRVAGSKEACSICRARVTRVEPGVCAYFVFLANRLVQSSTEVYPAEFRARFELLAREAAEKYEPKG